MAHSHLRIVGDRFSSGDEVVCCGLCGQLIGEMNLDLHYRLNCTAYPFGESLAQKVARLEREIEELKRKNEVRR